MCARDVLPNFVGGTRSMLAKKKKQRKLLHRSRKIWSQHLEVLSKQNGRLKRPSKRRHTTQTVGTLRSLDATRSVGIKAVRGVRCWDKELSGRTAVDDITRVHHQEQQH